MTTLTRTRKDSTTADGTRMTMLTVSGTEGAVSALDVWPAGTTGVSWCTATERPGYEMADECPLRGGQCWGDVYVSAVTVRVVDAWRSGADTAAYAVLEDLYRQEFES